MEENFTILIIALLVLGYGSISKLLYRFNISGPMTFTAVGVVLAALEMRDSVVFINNDLVSIISSLALIIVLFSDSSSISLKKLRKEWTIPARLLFIGLPLTIIMGTYMGKFIFPQEAFTYILLMALILAPTDAALGKAVVTDSKIPEKIRTSINVESGLNDGIVFPVLMTVIIMISQGQTSAQDNSWMGHVLQQIAFGGIVGSILGYICAKLFAYFVNKEWMDSNYQRLIPISIAILSYYLSEYFGGNGFIAAYFSGLLAGNMSETLREKVEEFSESEGELLILISFLVFGLVFIPATIHFWDLKVLVFTFLSLTFLRLIPVAISLIGTKFDLTTMLFIGWFGPRGIASILYVLIAYHEIGSIKGHETVYAVITLTILLSIIFHGLSAQPLAKRYAKNHKDEG